MSHTPNQSAASPRLRYHEATDWPCQAWVATFEHGHPEIRVFHGRRVEVREHWFCEAAWAGNFAEGDFDHTDIVAGTGCRLRDGRAIFVPPGTLVDRLHWLKEDGLESGGSENGGRVWVSNSFAALLAAVDGRIERSDPHHSRGMRSIKYRGFDDCRKSWTTNRGTLNLVYFDNLVWDGERLFTEEKPLGDRRFSDFATYADFMDQSMAALAANICHAERRHPLRFLGSLSSGYDGPTVTALASLHGCDEAICFTEDRQGQDDSGVPIGPHLGVEVIELGPNDWRRLDRPELPFIAGDAHADEVYLAAAEKHLEGRLLLTGYFGDRAWGKRRPPERPPFYYGGHGAALSEFRLGVGFLVCAPAYWGGRAARDIHAISTSEEMKPWEIPGPYSRPICRRILEEMGVPRELFGQAKRAVAVLLYMNDFLVPSSMADYLAWLRQHRGEWFHRWRLPPLRLPWLDRWTRQAINPLFTLAFILGQHWPKMFRELSVRLSEPFGMRRYIFPWALESIRSRYSKSQISTEFPIANSSSPEHAEPPQEGVDP